MSWRMLTGSLVFVAAAAASAAAWTARSGGSSGHELATSTDGERLFVAKGCAGCHIGPGGLGEEGMGLVDLSNAAAWAGERRPDVSAEEYIAESIQQPNAFRSPVSLGSVGPVTGMPTLTVSDEEVDALVEYLLQG